MNQQPIQPQQPYGQSAPPFPPIRQKKPWYKRWWAVVLFVIVGLGILGALLNPGGGDPTTAAPAPTVTVTETVQAPADEPDTQPTQQPTKAPAKFSPKTSDFQVNLKITSKQCFGSAGCIIDFEPKLAYKGSESDLPDVGLTSVTYQVSGGEDEFTDTLTVDGDGSVTGAGEQTVDTAGPSRKLVAKVTEVDYNEFG